MQTNPLLDIFYNKRLSTTGDIEMFLWYKCSLRCKFCAQPHGCTEGMTLESLDKKYNLVTDFYANSPLNTFITTILGGEIFDNSVSDDLLHGVMELFASLHATSLLLNKEVSFDNSTNLIYSDPYRVCDFYRTLRQMNLKLKMCVSYDLADRNLTSEQLELFKKNEPVVSEFIDVISFVMTKNTVRQLTDGLEDPYFRYLYEKYPVSFSLYNDNTEAFGKRNTLRLRPDEPELLLAINIVSRKYPKVYAIQRWRDQANKRMKSYNSCNRSKLVVYPDNTISSCTENTKCQSGCLASQLAQKRDCLCCEYFGYCQIDCFHSALDPKVKKIDPCLQKEIYNLLKE